MFQKLFNYILLTRPINSLITFLSIIIAGLLTEKGNIQWLDIFFASVSGALTCASGNIINDIYDIEIDRINKPNRVLPLGKISIKEAWLIYFITNITALILSSFINLYAPSIVLLSIFTLFFYSYKLKRVMLFGNITVAFLTGLAFIYGGIAVNSISNSIIPAVFAFLINLIREIVKDMEDIEGDFTYNITTFPKKFGNLKSIRFILLLTCILYMATLIPFIFRIYKIEYFITVMVIVNVILVYFIKSIFKDQSRRNLKRLSVILKINMVFGLFSIYMGI